MEIAFSILNAEKNGMGEWESMSEN